MSESKQHKEFGIISKVFHWSIFLLFLVQFGNAIAMYAVATKDYYPKDIFEAHKSVGLLLLFIAVARLMWRKLTPLPPWPESMTEFEKKSFHFLEIGLYTVMFLMPLSGYVFSLASGYGFKFFGLFEVPDLVGKNANLALFGKILHRVTAFIIVAFVVSHVSLILRRHFDSKDQFINRMSFLKSKTNS